MKLLIVLLHSCVVAFVLTVSENLAIASELTLKYGISCLCLPISNISCSYTISYFLIILCLCLFQRIRNEDNICP